TVNTGNEDGAVSLPDTTLHYVPFTYAGTVNAYSRKSAGVSTDNTVEPYDHSLFVADYNVTHTVSWNGLNDANLIFGKEYQSGGVGYTLRAPSAGSNRTGSGDFDPGVPQSNEWDMMLNKNSGYIQNWNKMYSWGQDTHSTFASDRAVRGCYSARYWYDRDATRSRPYVGFRPVLEVLNPDTLGSDGLKAVTLDLGGGKLGGSSEDIQIIVKNGSTFTAPASDSLTRPDGDTGSFFMWLGSNGKLYAPGASVPADVTKLTVQWTAPAYTVTLNTNGGTIADGKDVTGYTYGVGATLPTDVTRTGYTFKGWYDNENLTGSPVTAISNTETGNKEYWAKWEGNTGGSSSSSGGGSSSSGGGSGKTDTTTTTKPDGTKVQTETKKDGTKVETTTAKDGSTSKTTTNPNGSSVTENKAADGSTGTVKTDKNGQTTAETALSNKAIEDAKKSGEAVKAPVEVEATRNSDTAPTVKIELPRNSGETKVEIPVSNVKPGTVAVLVHADGTEEIVKNSLPTEDGIQLTVNGSATVKIVDNSKDFIDTRNHWAKDAIDFVSARGLVNGMNDSIYAPNNSTTRAQL
ncbi:InlB B-repeat-containing protein, partial [Agathobaculum butyriciproducens]